MKQASTRAEVCARTKKWNRGGKAIALRATNPGCEAEGGTRLPDKIDAGGIDKKAGGDPDSCGCGEGEACEGNEEEFDLRSVKVNGT